MKFHWLLENDGQVFFPARVQCGHVLEMVNLTKNHSAHCTRKHKIINESNKYKPMYDVKARQYRWFEQRAKGQFLFEYVLIWDGKPRQATVFLVLIESFCKSLSILFNFIVVCIESLDSRQFENLLKMRIEKTQRDGRN